MALASEASATTEVFSGYPDAFGVLHDTTLCIGCRSCELACNKVNSLPPPDRPFKDTTVLDVHRRTSPEKFTVVNKYPNPENAEAPIFVKTQCNHCMEPACASACFVKALRKTPEGPVVYDASLCVGCRYCMIACPFSIPTYEYNEPLTPRVQKCTLCYERIRDGGVPGCVEDCPVEAIVFGKRKDLLRLAHTRIQEHPDRYVDHVYGEEEVGGTNWLYITHAPFETIGMRTDLGNTSAPDLTRDFLSSVASVDILGPTFLLGLYAISKRRVAAADEEKAIEVEATVARKDGKGKVSTQAPAVKGPVAGSEEKHS